MKKIFLLLGATILTATSCSDIDKYNVDPKNPLTADPAFLFSNSQFNLAYQFVDANYNANVGRFWANYATQTTYIQESNYDASNRDIGGSMWDNIYTETLYELKQAKKGLLAQNTVTQSEADIKSNKIAMIKILEVFSYQYLVDTFGDIPFTDGLNADNVTPAYDDDEFVYNAIADSLSNAISMIKTNEASFNESDLFYGGDMNQWKKLAHSLQLKIGIRLADFNNTKATSLITQAVAGGVFESNDDNLTFQFTGTQPYVNPVYSYFVISKRASDFVATKNFLDLLTGLDDPRLDVYYDDNIAGGMVGGVYGATGNSYNGLTHINPEFTTNSTLPAVLMEYSTVQFELAEAAARGIIAGDAEEFYNEGIKASFLSLGLTETEADDYIATVPYSAANYKQSIGIQKYISLFNNGHEAWTEARRLKHPQLQVAAASGRPNPSRMIYPTDEKLINSENYNAAVSNMGADDYSTKIFWDVN